jgi:hypothetical protein
LPDLHESVRALESKWAKVILRLERKHEQLVKGKPEWAKKELVNIDFSSLNLSPAKERPPIKEDIPPLLAEYQSAFKEASLWVDSVEARIKDKKSNDKHSREVDLGQEVEEWTPKMADLRAMSEKVVHACKREDLKNEMKRLDQRWEEIVKEVEERLKPTLAFHMIETKGSPAKPEEKNPATTLDEETIQTLPEENLTPVKRRLPAELDLDWKSKEKSSAPKRPSADELLSSGESSPDLEIVTGTMVLKSNSPTFVRETVSKIPKIKSSPVDKKVTSPVKSPPKTLPKPQWFSLEKSPEKVPKNGNNNNVGKDDEDVEAFLAKENSAIERILSEATSDLAEVQKKASYSQAKNKMSYDLHQRDLKQFEESVTSMHAKMEKANLKLDQLENEQDLRLKRDFIGMEARLLEAEVATLISRGDTLILLSHRDDVAKGELLQKRVSKLRETWKRLKQRADKMIDATEKTEEDIRQFRKDVFDVKRWLEDTNRKLQRKPNEDDLVKLANEVKAKKVDIDHLSHQSLSWPKNDMMGTQEVALTMIKSQWETLQQKVLKYCKDRNIQTANLKDANKQADQIAIKAASDEILQRIEKMREAVKAIERQMTTQVLAGKVFENLEDQSQALQTVKEALETLRPNIRGTAKDLEVLTGSLSLEYLEKIVIISEKLRDEWREVKRNYSERYNLWVASNDKHTMYQKRRVELENWLERAEHLLVGQQTHVSSNKNTPTGAASPEQIQIERQVSEKNKEVTDLAMLGKDIMSQTSAQQHLEIQTQVDKILKRWKFLLSQLATQREILNKEKFHNNVNYISRWINDNQKKVNAVVNPSDVGALNEAIQFLHGFDEALVEKDKQMDKLCNSNAAISSDVVHKLRNKYDNLIQAIPKRLQELQEQVQAINDLTSKVVTASVWIEHLEGQEPVSPNKASFKKVVDEKEAELEAILNSYDGLVKEARRKDFAVEKQLAEKVSKLKSQWEAIKLNQTTPSKSPRALKNTSSQSVSANGARSNLHRQPQIFANLRDHRDWIQRKRRQLGALALAGNAESVQRQLDEHVVLR